MSKGVSTILGTIILIGIAIAAGASIFTITNQYAIVGFSKTEYTVVEALFTKTTDPQCFLYVKLMNTGTEQISQTELEISIDDVIPESLRIDKDSPLEITTDDSMRFLFWTSNNTLFVRKSGMSIEPTDNMTIDSIIFTNMTGKVQTVSSDDFENKLQPLFNQCDAWQDCLTYTMDVLGTTTDNSQTVISHTLLCREVDRI